MSELRKSRKSGVSGTRAKTIIIKVAKPFRERHSNAFKLKKFGELKEVPTAVIDTKDYKKTIGSEGWMTKEDYENGLFSEYGLKAEDVQGHSELDLTKKEKESLLARIAELEAEKAPKIKKEPDPKV